MEGKLQWNDGCLTEKKDETGLLTLSTSEMASLLLRSFSTVKALYLIASRIGNSRCFVYDQTHASTKLHSSRILAGVTTPLHLSPQLSNGTEFSITILVSESGRDSF